MTVERALYEAVRAAWASIPPPPPEELQYMEWGWGEEAARSFIGIAPVDVDIASVGFAAATPLLDLPPQAAAAYLGPYLLSLLHSLERQKAIGIFYDVVTRAHTITCLTSPRFWEQVIRPFLPSPCREVLARVVAHFATERKALALTDAQAELMLSLAGVRG
jgi:hypothetical protein